MKELVEVIAKSLVEHPEEVAVTETENEKTILVELRVAPSDMGKVNKAVSQKRSAVWLKQHHQRKKRRLLWRFCSRIYHRTDRRVETPAVFHRLREKRTQADRQKGEKHGVLFKGRRYRIHPWLKGRG